MIDDIDTAFKNDITNYNRSHVGRIEGHTHQTNAHCGRNPEHLNSALWEENHWVEIPAKTCCWVDYVFTVLICSVLFPHIRQRRIAQPFSLGLKGNFSPWQSACPSHTCLSHMPEDRTWPRRATWTNAFPQILCLTCYITLFVLHMPLFSHFMFFPKTWCFCVTLYFWGAANVSE